MGFIKPTITGVRSPTDRSFDTGKIHNPPRFLEFGGLSKPSKLKKNDKAVTDRGAEGKGPYSNQTY